MKKRELTEIEQEKYLSYADVALLEGVITYETYANKHGAIEKSEKYLSLEQSDKDLLEDIKILGSKLNKVGYTEEDIDTYLDMILEAAGRELLTRGQVNSYEGKIKAATGRLME